MKDLRLFFCLDPPQMYELPVIRAIEAELGVRYSQSSRSLMQTQQSAWLVAPRTILTAAAIWVSLGVPTAAFIAGTILFVFVIYAVPEMAVAAATLGAAQGLCLFLAAKWSRTAPGTFLAANSTAVWFGAVFGGALGLLGFVPVYSRTSITTDFPVVIIFVVAAMSGGAIAGAVCCRKLTGTVLGPLSPIRSFVVVSLFVLALAAIDQKMYWTAFDNRHPMPVIVLTNLSAGDARGTAWSGCYDYSGRLSDGTGGEGGRLVVRQADGVLEISEGDLIHYRGGVQKNGQFSAEAKTDYDQETIRTLWNGRFDINSTIFTKRDTLVRHGWPVSTRKVTGTAQRIPCGP